MQTAARKHTPRDPFIVATQVAKRQLGMADDDYRQVLSRIAGVTSSTQVPEGKRQAVLEEFTRLGATSAPKAQSANRRASAMEGPFAPKLRALWIAGWNLGVFRDRSDAALMANVTKMTGIERSRWLCNPHDANKAIEGLKAWLTREANVDWKISPRASPWRSVPGYLIAWAQFRLLEPDLLEPDLEPVIAHASFWAAVDTVVGGNFRASFNDGSDWMPVMNHFGKHIRGRQAIAASVNGDL